MLNWIKNFFKKVKEDNRIEELAKYRQFVYDCCKNEKNDLIGNFSYDGYKYIFENMIFGAKFSIYVFCEDYDKIFTDELYPLFKLKTQSGITVRIITYNGKKDSGFEELAKQSPNCKYYALSCNDTNKMNNFFVVDNRRYWIDDKSWFVRKDFSKLKACACFNDFKKCAKMTDVFNMIADIGDEITDKPLSDK